MRKKKSENSHSNAKNEFFKSVILPWIDKYRILVAFCLIIVYLKIGFWNPYKPANILGMALLICLLLGLLIRIRTWFLNKIQDPSLGDITQLVALLIGFCWISVIIIPQEMPHFTQKLIECPYLDYNLDLADGSRDFNTSFIELKNTGNLPSATWLDYDMEPSEIICDTLLNGRHDMNYYRDQGKKCQSVEDITAHVIEPQGTYYPPFKFEVPKDVNTFKFTISLHSYLANIPQQARYAYWFLVNGERKVLDCTCYVDDNSRDHNMFACNTGRTGK